MMVMEIAVTVTMVKKGKESEGKVKKWRGDHEDGDEWWWREQDFYYKVKNIIFTGWNIKEKEWRSWSL